MKRKNTDERANKITSILSVLWNHRVLQRIPKKCKKIKIW